MMKRHDSDFDEFFVTTVLAELFDPTGSEDPDIVAEKIVDGLNRNGLINCKEFDDDLPMAA